MDESCSCGLDCCVSAKWPRRGDASCSNEAVGTRNAATQQSSKEQASNFGSRVADAWMAFVLSQALRRAVETLPPKKPGCPGATARRKMASIWADERFVVRGERDRGHHRQGGTNSCDPNFSERCVRGS